MVDPTPRADSEASLERAAVAGPTAVSNRRVLVLFVALAAVMASVLGFRLIGPGNDDRALATTDANSSLGTVATSSTVPAEAAPPAPTAARDDSPAPQRTAKTPKVNTKPGAIATSTTTTTPELPIASPPINGWASIPFLEPDLLPVPDPLPLDPYAPTEQVVIGELEIPRLGVSEELQQGMTLTAINRGPSHWAGTAAPGRPGNVVIAGHRTTNGAPFNGLDLLVPGDEATFSTTDGQFRYRVRETEIVTPDALHIATQTDVAEATLFACHPKGSARQRIVVRFDLVESQPNAALG